MAAEPPGGPIPPSDENPPGVPEVPEVPDDGEDIEEALDALVEELPEDTPVGALEQLVVVSEQPAEESSQPLIVTDPDLYERYRNMFNNGDRGENLDKMRRAIPYLQGQIAASNSEANIDKWNKEIRVMQRILGEEDAREAGPPTTAEPEEEQPTEEDQQLETGPTAAEQAAQEAATRQTAAEQAAQEAATRQTAAEQAAQEAATRQTAAEQAAQEATARQAAAEQAAQEAEARRTAAEQAAQEAEARQTAAEQAAQEAVVEQSQPDLASRVAGYIDDFLASDQRMEDFLGRVDQDVADGNLTPAESLRLKTEVNKRVAAFLADVNSQLTDGSMTVGEAREFFNQLNNPVLKGRGMALVDRFDHAQISFRGNDLRTMAGNLLQRPEFQNLPPAVRTLIQGEVDAQAGLSEGLDRARTDSQQIATALRALEGNPATLHERINNRFYLGRLALPAIVALLIAAGAVALPFTLIPPAALMGAGGIGTSIWGIMNIHARGGHQEYMRTHLREAAANFRNISEIEERASRSGIEGAELRRSVLDELIKQNAQLIASSAPGTQAQKTAASNALATRLGANINLSTSNP